MNQPVTVRPPFDIIAMGEALVDLTQVDVDSQGVALYERNPGGAPANLSAAAAKLGLATAFVGVVGDDSQGHFVLDALRDCGVRVDTAVYTTDACTTLAFATFDSAHEEYTYSFVRKPGADQLLKPQDLPNELLARTRVLHVGTFSLTAEPARGTVLDAVGRAHDLGCLVSCDVNYRSHVWENAERARTEARGLIGHCDLLKVSEEEAHLLCGDSADLARAAVDLLDCGPCLVAITRGHAGALLATRAGIVEVDAFVARQVLDTTGAGDSFWGATLAWLLREGRVAARADVERLTLDDLATCGSYACAAASLSVERPGGMTSSPTMLEVAERLVEGE